MLNGLWESIGSYWPYAIVLLFGTLAGVAEIASRYRDDPWRAAFLNDWGLIYIFVNAGISALILYLIRNDIFLKDWLTSDAIDLRREFIQILVAGFSGLALLRTSFLNLNIANSNVPIGPAVIVNVLLDTMSLSLARSRSRRRTQQADELSHELIFDKAHKQLVPYCLALVPQVSTEQARSLISDVTTLAAKNDIDDSIKNRQLCLILFDVFGFDTVKLAIDSLSDVIHSATGRASRKLSLFNTVYTPDYLRMKVLPICLKVSGRSDGGDLAISMLRASIEDSVNKNDFAENSEVQAREIWMLLHSVFPESVVNAALASLNKEAAESRSTERTAQRHSPSTPPKISRDASAPE